MTSFIRKKRYQLLGLALLTLVAVALSWLLVVRPLQQKLKVRAAEIPQLKGKIQTARQNAQLADKMKSDLEQAQLRLEAQEEKMAQGDLYRWMINKLLGFQEKHVLEFGEFDRPQVGELNPALKLPYKTAQFGVTGSASYHHFGVFLSDFENSYPTFRLRRIDLDPAIAAQSVEESEHSLNFRIEFQTLAKPVTAQ